MGVESLYSRQTFGLEELGLLDTSPLKTLDTIVDLCAEALHAPIVAFMIFDDTSASLIVRSIVGDHGLRAGTTGVPIEHAASGLVRTENGVVSISNLEARTDTINAFERRRIGATGLLAAPVHGPLGETIGALAAMTPTEHHWTKHERRLIGNYALLLTEQVMFRAALQTVKLMAKERADMGMRVKFRN